MPFDGCGPNAPRPLILSRQTNNRPLQMPPATTSLKFKSEGGSLPEARRMAPARIHRPSSSSPAPRSPVDISRRQLLAGAGAAALLLEQRSVRAQPAPGRTTVFAHTTIVTVDTVQNDVALAVEGDKIAAIGPTETVLMNH